MSETILSSEEQKAELKTHFDHFDLEQKGFIDKLELQYLMKALDFPMNSKQINELVKSFGPETHERGSINLEQFEAVMAEQYSLVDPEEELRKSFRLFDCDNTGKITRENLLEMSKLLGENLSEVNLQHMIDEFDVDKDGGLSMDEYLTIFEHFNIVNKISGRNPSKKKDEYSSRR